MTPPTLRAVHRALDELRRKADIERAELGLPKLRIVGRVNNGLPTKRDPEVSLAMIDAAREALEDCYMGDGEVLLTDTALCRIYLAMAAAKARAPSDG